MRQLLLEGKTIEDIVALRGLDTNLGLVAVLTWGRVFDPVDETQLVTSIQKFLELRGYERLIKLDICEHLGDVSHYKYFHEGLLNFAWDKPRFGSDYESWRIAKAANIKQGKDIYVLASLKSNEG